MPALGPEISLRALGKSCDVDFEVVIFRRTPLVTAYSKVLKEEHFSYSISTQLGRIVQGEFIVKVWW